VSPKTPDPRIRTALIEAAARLLTEDGPEALTTRRLAAEVGTSTMAVYTYFDGMDALRLEVRREGFARLAQFLEAIEATEDTVADVAALGGAYLLNAIVNRHLYDQMFGAPPDEHDPEVGHDTLERLVDAVALAVAAGRFQGDPWDLATQCWAMAHGIVTLHLAGLLTLPEAIQTFAAMGRNLFVGFGDDPGRTEGSIAAAHERIQATVESTLGSVPASAAG
jgi:AcrR family transcriptional regulator